MASHGYLALSCALSGLMCLVQFQCDQDRSQDYVKHVLGMPLLKIVPISLSIISFLIMNLKTKVQSVI